MRQENLHVETTQVNGVDGLRPSKLERCFAARLGHDYAATFGHGRTALWAALSASGVAGGRVLVPAFTCACVVDAVIAAGAEPLFFDVDPVSFEPDSRRVGELIPHAGALIVIDYFGWPCRALAPLTEIARTHEVTVIDDRAHLLSTRFRPGDEQPDYTVYSLPKLLPCAAGGILAAVEPERWIAAIRARDTAAPTAGAHSGRSSVAERASRFRRAVRRERDDLTRLAEAAAQRFGWPRARAPIEGQSEFPYPEEPLRGAEPPYAPAMSRVTYGLAAVTLRSLAARQERAQTVGLRLQERLAPVESLPRARSLTDAASAFLYFPLLLRGPNATEAIAHARSKGVDLRRSWPLHPRCNEEAAPGATYLREHLVLWQVNLHISDAEVDDVGTVLEECAQI